MTEITLRFLAKNSMLSEDSIKQIITDALVARLNGLQAGIRITQDRLKAFESKYQMSTEEFLHRFENDEFQHSLDFDEWIGEAWMLESLNQEKQEIGGIELVN